MSEDTPAADDTPTVSSTPVEPSTTPAAAPAPAARDEDDVAPTTAAAPPAAAVATTSTDDHRSGFFVPKWLAVGVAVVIAALVFGGIGYAIGDSSGGDSNSQNASTAFPGVGNGSQNGGRTFPGLGGQGNGNSNNGNGNSNNGNGNGNGSSGSGSSGNGQTTAGTGFLGVAIADGTNGAQVANVQSGSPAATAGLQSGDVITVVDGTSITSASDLVQAVQSHNSGDKITVTYTRDGKSATVSVTLGSAQTSQNS